MDPSKIQDYLLSTTHPIGRHEASFFAKLGYTRDAWQQLENDLRRIAQSGDTQLDQMTPYGLKFHVRGILKGPSGASAEIVTVWIVLANEDVPRFITAFPGGTR